MAIGINTSSGGGNYSEVVKWDARAGRMFRVDREETASGWESNNVEITDGFQALFDFDSVQVGWMLFAQNVAPQFTMAPLGSPFPDRPTDQHKQGFRIMLKLGKASGGDVREFASTSKAVIGSFDALHDAYLAGVGANPGKLPLVALKGSTTVTTTGKGQTSTNYSPNFEITKWLDRPPELAGVKPAAERPALESLPKSEPVKAAPAKQLETVDDNDF